MKKFYLLLLFCVCMLFSACNPNEGKEDNLLVDVNGSWTLYDDTKPVGCLTFENYESFVLEINDKPTVFADIFVMPNKSPVITISYAEDEDGNEIEYDGVWTCEIYPLTPDKAYISNLPYYNDTKLTMIKI